MLARLAPEVRAMRFMDVRAIALMGETCVVSRSGYTGEDGFEISIAAGRAEALCEALLRDRRVAPVGPRRARQPAARSGPLPLRLRPRPATTPVEAALEWTIAAGAPCRRRARRRLSRRGRHLAPARQRRGAPAGRAAAGRPCAGARRRAAVSARGRCRAGRHRDLRRVRRKPRCADRHGLCADRERPRRERGFSPRCAASGCRSRSPNCPSCRRTTNAVRTAGRSDAC